MSRFALGLIALSLVCAPAVAWGQTEPAPPPPEPAPAPAPAGQPAPPPPGSQPPPQYYVEPPAARGPQQTAPQPARPAQPGVYEPPPPGYGYGPTLIYEPPPPPKPRHVAPKYSFWLGARLGWFIPFGGLWTDVSQNAQNQLVGNDVLWSDYASSGPMFELDVGARLGRNYNLFLTWERAALGPGSLAPDANGGQETGDTDFFAIGLRVSSEPDKVGLLTEIDIGARRFRAAWADGTELQATDAILEARLGLGADIRLSPLFSLSPLITLGVGGFGSAEWVDPNGNRTDATDDLDERITHGWVTFQLGGHFDIAGGG